MKNRTTKITLLIMIMASAFFASCSKQIETNKIPEIQAVTTTFPQIKSFSRTFDTASVVKAYKSAYINPKVGGTIQKFHVKEGDKVKKGQVLAQLDPSDYQIAVSASSAQIAAAEAGVMQASAAFDNISQNYERFKELKENGTVSDSDFEKVESGYKQTEAGLAAAKAQLQLAQSAHKGNTKQLNYTTIRAPFSGFVSSRRGEIGEMASPASPMPMFEVVQSDKLKVDIFISELEIAGINKDTTAEIRFDAFPEKVEIAKVRLINSKVNSSTKSVKVELTLDNKKYTYKPGMTIKVRITLPETSHLVVPRNAIFTRDNEAGLIYIKNEADRVFTKEIFLGGTTDGFSIIKSGLDGKEEIVIGGGRRLEEGQKVKVIETIQVKETATAKETKKSEE